MKLGSFVQWIAVAAIWVLVILLLVVLALVSFLLSAWSLPAWWILVLFALGVVGTAFVLTTDRFESLNRQLEDKLDELSDDELIEVRDVIHEVRGKFGIDIQVPIKAKGKNKREAIDRAVRNLSDTELLHLKAQLRSGEVDEARLLAWLDTQREAGDKFSS